jgi:hypothetical protein
VTPLHYVHFIIHLSASLTKKQKMVEEHKSKLQLERRYTTPIQWTMADEKGEEEASVVEKRPREDEATEEVETATEGEITTTASCGNR